MHLDEGGLQCPGGPVSLLMAIGGKLTTIPEVWRFDFCSDIFRNRVLTAFISARSSAHAHWTMSHRKYHGLHLFQFGLSSYDHRAPYYDILEGPWIHMKRNVFSPKLLEDK